METPGEPYTHRFPEWDYAYGTGADPHQRPKAADDETIPVLPKGATLFGVPIEEWVYDPVAQMWAYHGHFGERITFPADAMEDLLREKGMVVSDQYAPEPCEHLVGETCDMCEIDQFLDDIIGETEPVETEGDDGWRYLDMDQYKKLTPTQQVQYQQWQQKHIRQLNRDLAKTTLDNVQATLWDELKPSTVIEQMLRWKEQQRAEEAE